MSFKVYDNGKTFDRYTVIVDSETCYGMSVNALSPQGLNHYIGTNTVYAGMIASRDKPVKFENLPEAVQKAIQIRVGEQI